MIHVSSRKASLNNIISLMERVWSQHRSSCLRGTETTVAHSLLIPPANKLLLDLEMYSQVCSVPRGVGNDSLSSYIEVRDTLPQAILTYAH